MSHTKKCTQKSDMSLGYVSRDVPVGKKTPKVVCPPVIVAQARVKDITRADVLWKYAVIVLSTVSSVTLVINEIVRYSVRVDYVLPLLVVCFAVLAINLWLEMILSMNLFRKFNADRYSAIYLYVLAMGAYLASSLAVMRLDYALQFVDSFVASTIAWTAFFTVFEGRYFFPTRQQFISLMHIWLATAMWELRTYLVNRHLS